MDDRECVWIERTRLYDPWQDARVMAADFMELAQLKRRSVKGVLWFVRRWGALGLPSRGADRAELALGLDGSDPLGARLLRQEGLVPPAMPLAVDYYLESARRYERFVAALATIQSGEPVDPRRLRSDVGLAGEVVASDRPPKDEVEYILQQHVIDAVGYLWERPSVAEGQLVPIKLFGSLLVPIYWSTGDVKWLPCHYPGCSALRGYARRAPRAGHCEAHVRICPRRDEHDERSRRASLHMGQAAHPVR